MGGEIGLAFSAVGLAVMRSFFRRVLVKALHKLLCRLHVMQPRRGERGWVREALVGERVGVRELSGEKSAVGAWSRPLDRGGGG